MPRAIFKNTFINSTKHYCVVILPLPFFASFCPHLARGGCRSIAFSTCRSLQ
ncbi:unnamed protein product [Meloidogyne enterolobii]|uniref:Uncharacterized protein n=1 Tax=Meloidogyne enterolobii TaxID=390850 RepID=A0ACB0YYB5_MELEN